MAIAKRKKRFFDVEIPLVNKVTQLQAYESKELQGKYLLYDLTRLLRGKGAILKLRVSVEGDKATSNPIELKIMPSFIRRMMRKGVNYIEDSLSIECKDAVLRIKPFLITRKKVSKAVQKALREKVKEELTEYVKTKDVKILFEDIMKNKIQKSLSLKLKKIYPLSLCEIRFFAIESQKTSTPSEK